MPSLKFSLVLLSLIGLTITTKAEPKFANDDCRSNTSTFTVNSSYQNNLNHLLDSLSSNATSNVNGFYNTSFGQAPNEVVYGYFLCRGDLSTEVCRDCVTFATKDIVQRCPNRKEAHIRYDECFLRYSNQSIFLPLEQAPMVVIWTTEDVEVNGRFNELLLKVMNETASQAANAPSGAKLFAVKEVIYIWYQNISSLAECIPVLNGPGCNLCLKNAIATLSDIVNLNKGGKISAPNCYFRYEMYRFYNETAIMALPPSPVVPPPPPAPDGGSSSKWIKIGASLSVIPVVLLFSSCTYAMWRRKNMKKEEKENNQEVQLLDLGGGTIGDDYSHENIKEEKLVNSEDLPLIRLDIIHEATKHFSDENKLGQGGFGPVYKGTLKNGKEIAVKRLSKTSGQGLREFMNEVTLIARLQHRNLVKLLGCCLENNEKLLIYEYLPNKSLDVFLFDSSMAMQLDWQRRRDIINGVARGLLYLHQDSRLRIIHRDLKASNVLLDYEMNPKISDFGMARIFGGNQGETNTNRIVGTYGYMAPEYAMEGMFSVKSDVFSFGVLLLETISGRRNSGFHLSEKGESLLTFAWKLWSKGQGLELMDPLLLKSRVDVEVLKCIHIGLLCVQEDPADRPTMSSVVVILGSDTLTLPQPTQPAFSIGRVVARTTQFSNHEVCSINEITLSTVSSR